MTYHVHARTLRPPWAGGCRLKPAFQVVLLFMETRIRRGAPASCCENATPPDDGDGEERRSSDRHRPRSGRNSWASFCRMAPPSKGMARRQLRARTPLSPSSFRVRAMGRDSTGSFAACGRDAGLKTGAPRSWHLGVFMPGGARRRARAWVFLPVGVSDRHAARRAAGDVSLFAPRDAGQAHPLCSGRLRRREPSRRSASRRARCGAPRVPAEAGVPRRCGVSAVRRCGRGGGSPLPGRLGRWRRRSPGGRRALPGGRRGPPPRGRG